MNVDAIPIVKFSIEGMKAQILSHLGVVGSELGVVLDEEITNAVNSYPWQQKVDDIVHDAIQSSIRSYFTYGDGATEIREMVQVAMSKKER